MARAQPVRRLDPVDNPFVGLRPFETEDSHYYFGRDQQVKALLARLHQSRFLAVVGSSGAGKSSLVRAGLIPELEAGFLVQDRDLWRVATLTPGDAPIANLTAALHGAFATDSDEAPSISAFRAEGAIALLDLLTRGDETPDTNTLLVIDQFEELFAFVGKVEADGAASDASRLNEAAEFVNLLLKAAQQRSHPVYVCTTMRSDFLGDCDYFVGLPEAMNAGQYLVPRLTRSQRKAAIYEPVILTGHGISPRLLDRLLNEDIGTRDDLPVLQHALLRTWDRWADADDSKDRLDFIDYERAGTVHGALNADAQAAFEELSEDNRPLVRRIFQALTEVDEANRRVRRRRRMSQLKALLKVSEAKILTCLEPFQRNQRAFIRISEWDHPSGALIDISHESLIRQWHTLTAWVDSEGKSQEQRQTYRLRAQDHYSALVSGRHDGTKTLLLRDSALEDAERWFNEHTLDRPGITAAELDIVNIQSFLLASRELEDDERKREKSLARLKTGAFVLMTLLAIIAGVSVYLGLQQTKQLEEQAVELKTKTEEVGRQAEKSEELRLQAGLNLAKFFEEKALAARDGFSRELRIPGIQQAIVFAASALLQEVPEGETTLAPDNLFSLFGPDFVDGTMAYQGISPTQHTGSGADFGVAFNPNGKRLAAWSSDETVRLWDVVTGAELHLLAGHTGAVSSVVFSPNGKHLASASMDKTVRLWDAKTGAGIQKLRGHTGAVRSVSFSPNGQLLASASEDETVRLWKRDIGTGLMEPTVHMELTGHTGPVHSVAFSPDGKHLASASSDKTIRLWNIKTGIELRVLEGHTGAVLSVAFSRDGRLASASGDKTVRLWNIGTGTQPQALTKHTGPVRSVAFSPDGKILASASEDQTVRLWEADTGKGLRVLSGHKGEVVSVVYSPNGRLASASADKTVRLWRADTGAEIQVLNGAFRGIAYSPDGSMLASALKNNIVRSWERDEETNLMVQSRNTELIGHTGSVLSVAFSPRGKHLASTSGDKTVRLWNLATGDMLHELTGHTGPVRSAAFGPKGIRLASASDDKTVRLWNLVTWDKPTVLAIHTGSVYGVAFSPNGKRLASASSDKSVWIWDTSTGHRLRELTGHSGPVHSVAFSPDGKRLASASSDKTVRIWDAASGKELQELKGHSGKVFGVAFSPTGFHIASASEDKTVRLWDAFTGAKLDQLKGHSYGVQSVAFSPDGKRLASVSTDHTLRLWRIDQFAVFDLITKEQRLDVFAEFVRGVEYFWQIERRDLEVIPMDADTIRKKHDASFLPLLNPPQRGNTKVDQILNWARKRANAK